MDVGFLVARILHIGLGVFWAGAMIFNAAFLTPSMRDAGPDAAKVSAGLMRRGFLNVMPIVAIITLISGLYLYWRMSGGFAIAYITSPMGLMYGLGGIAALIAFILGVGIMRPSMLRAASLAQAATAGDPETREAALSTVGALRARAAAVGQVVAWLLGAATIAMAVARYA